ncbi:serine hydrolase domain-containing protein [Aspergillus undulatus]|uniref:serine hydrolase domain-containing protein n=1 Tax=Aspergillus undulatus TaxID=1810928 RepID=UPI003CCD0288
MRKIVLHWLFVAPVVALTCPLAGPIFPAPNSPSDSVAFEKAIANLTKSIENKLTPANSTQYTAIDPDQTSFTVQVYSARHSKPLFEYYHTATSAQNNTIGVNTVDQDTVFRIGSVSKLWAVLLLLMESGDAALHEPLHKYIPELRETTDDLKDNVTVFSGIDNANWEHITIGELASHTAGLGRSYGLGDRSTDPSPMLKLGFPHLADSLIPKCGFGPMCNRAEFFENAVKRPPVVSTSSSPVYSNDAFQLLGYVIEEMAGEKIRHQVDKRLIERLELTRSSYSKPADRVGIIPGPLNATAWDMDYADMTLSGGIYSSTKDLSTLGRAILNNDLLSPALTRRWLKPVARTADRAISVGAPFEIYHLNQPRPIDLFAKSGDIGAYSAMVGLSPEHNVGFTILAAGDLVTTIMIPALDAVAKEEARLQFGGTYTSGSDKLTLITDEGPGLRITKWENKGKDMLESLASLQWERPEGELDVRLYPSGLRSHNKISFRAIMTAPPPTGPPNGPFTNVCISWLTVDSPVYGSIAVDDFVFEIRKEGNALSVSPRVLRTTLRRDTNDTD